MTRPQAEQTVVRLTDDAIEDLQTVQRKGDPQIVRKALKKMLLLQRDPEAGEPLVGGLIGYRKLTIGNRSWRLIWRIEHDTSGAVTVTVAEVWCLGARSDGEVYGEMQRRVAVAGPSPRATALADVIERLGKVAADLPVTEEPEDEPMPAWLPEVLVRVVGLAKTEVSGMTARQAHDAWDSYTSGAGR